MNKIDQIKIAVVGAGFVGSAVQYGFDNSSVEVTMIDPKLGSTVDDLCGEYEAVFVCVPTPMSDDGSINSSIAEEVMQKLANKVKCPIVLKSTVTPDLVQKYSDQIMNFVYNPEFLTERNYKHDFVNPTHHIFGGSEDMCKKLEEVYSYSNCKPCPVKYCTAAEASMIKYGINTFLATKVAWMNEYYDLAMKLELDYDQISSGMQLDPRIGLSHMQVPGPDGKRWFGGPCFKKDISALITFEPNLQILNLANKINDKGRSQYELDDREKEQNVVFG